MRFKIIAGVTALAVLTAVAFYVQKESKPSQLTDTELERKDRKAKKARFAEARAKYEFDMIKDPVTGKVPEGIFEKEIAFARTLPVKGYDASGRILSTNALNNYLPAGPNNIGGRTRAVAYDVRYNGTTNRVILAGCVSGGIMRSADGGFTWQFVTPEENIHSLTALAQDPRPGFQNTWYAGSGEFLGNSASSIGAPYLGYGLWKSTDNGVTWNKLPVTIANYNAPNEYTAFDHPYDFVYDIDVNPVNGHVYVCSWVLLLKSTDQGGTFNAVFQTTTGSASSATGQTDIEITNTGKLILGVNGGASDATKRGVWVSSTGDLNSWTRIAGGSTVGVDAVDGWRGNSTNGSSRRILLALAPSNNNILYVYYQNGLSSDPPQLLPEADLFMCDMSNNTYTWSNRSANMPDFPGQNLSGSDPLTVQGGYDMEVAVHPTNPDIVFVGGTNLYRSTNGFTTNSNTAWIGGYKNNFTYGQYENSHADIHKLVFNPSNPNEAICGNDGGIQVTTNITASNVDWIMLPNYQTLQYYNVSIDPQTGRNNFAGGSQDNGVRMRDKTGIIGTPQSDSNNHRLLFSADGATVAFSTEASGSQYLYESIQYGDLRRVTFANGTYTTSFDISPTGLTTYAPGATDGFGEFVTNFRLIADNTEDLYYVNFNRLFRTTNASSVNSNGWTELTGVSETVSSVNGRNISIRGTANSRGPYLTTHALYIGTTNGRIFRLDDPRNAAPTKVPVDITPVGLTGNVQDISVNPNDDNEILAVVSNYNTLNIWWTKNAKSANPTWVNAEGNLTLPSIRSCMIVVKKDASNNPVTEYYVGTSIGLYSTTNIEGGSPVWQREGGKVLNYAVVQSLAYRPSDNVLLVGTHGNGMYYTYLGTPNYTPNIKTGINNPVLNDKNFINAVYPTTTNNYVEYRIGNMFSIKKLNIQLYNINGQKVIQRESGYENGKLNIQGLSSGNYVLIINSPDGKYRHTQKIIKQ